MASTLGSHLNDAGRFREAADLLEPYAARSEPNLDVLLTRGAALAADGTDGGGARRSSGGRSSSPPRTRGSSSTSATSTWRRVSYAAAREAFDAALARKRDLARAHNGLGVVDGRDGPAWTRPSSAGRAAVRLDPRDWDTLFNLGRLLRRAGRAEEARPFVERFAREAPPSLYARDVREARAWLGGTREKMAGP